MKTNGGLAVPLTLLFIALKLMGYIHCSWWWVLSPLWITFLLVCIYVVVTKLRK